MSDAPLPPPIPDEDDRRRGGTPDGSPDRPRDEPATELPPGVVSVDPGAASVATAAAAEPADPPAADAEEPAGPDDEPDFSALVLDVLADGPATGFEIARRLDLARPRALGAREGYLYPLLVTLRREGLVEPRWEDRADGRRRTYALRGAERRDSVPIAGLDTSRIAPSRAVRRLADAATAKLSFAPRLAEECRAEIVRHVLDGAEVRRRGGVPPDEAERESIRALGDPWKVATDLARAARGRPVVLFPRTASEAFHSLVLYDAGILVAIVATVLFVRLQVVAAYHIPTKSMEPTLHGDHAGGDRILVLRLAPPPARFDIEVFEGWDRDRRQYVKRCVGLPGEDVKFLEGDLWVDGALVRKDGDAYEALLFPLFDVAVEAHAADAGGDAFGKRLQDRWEWSGGTEWKQWADGGFGTKAVEGGEVATLRWRGRLEDALYDEETGALEDGVTDVADGRITLDVTPRSEDAQILVRWTRGAEVCDAVLRGEQPGVSLAVDRLEKVRDADVAIPVGRTTRVRFAQVDRVLRLEVDGRPVLRYDLDAPSVPRRNGPSGDVEVRIPRGEAVVRPVRLERDVHWTSEYEGLDRGRLGPDEYFMVGDNSSNSQDSRVRGPVHRSRLVGTPLLVVWPPRRFHVPR